MWELKLVELDHYVDPKTGQQKSEEIERYYMREVEDLTHFLINIRKDVKKHPEFFCPACGFWTSYRVVLSDLNNNVIALKNLFNLFLENDEFCWDFEKISVKQLREILANGLT